MSAALAMAQVKKVRNVSEIMRRVRSRDTSPEVAFRKALSSQGVRYRLYSEKLLGKPDVVLPSKRLAVFIDGDFWHGGQWQRRALATLEEQFLNTSTKDYWLQKIRRNISRDLRTTATLIESGWTVLRFWESDLKKNLEQCVEMTIEVAQKGATGNSFSLAPQRTVAEFFAGIGLMRLGLEKEGWVTVFANDIDLQKHEMYKTHFSDDECYTVEDVHKLSATEVPTVTLATASFPCNDLSLAGSRAGLRGKQSSAFWGFVRVLDQMNGRRPPLVLLENVTGFLTSHDGSDFETALLALNKLGYVVDAFILDAARFVPQSRQRLFVVGVMRREQAASGIRILEITESDTRPRTLVEFINNHPGIAWNARNLPALPKNATRLEDIVEDLNNSAPEWWSEERVTYLLDQMSARHRETAERMKKGKQWSYGTVFRRIRNEKSMAELRIDGIAGCLRTPRGGSGRQILFKAGKGKCFARLLTPRECARLMGTDDFKITAPLNQALFGFGDAVCVPVVQWIARHYLNPTVNEFIRGKPLHLQREPAVPCR